MATEFKPNYAMHPGVMLGNFIKELGLTQTKVAERMGISKTILNEIIKGKRDINATYAVQLEPIFDLSATYWLNLQTSYDEAIARKNTGMEENIFKESVIHLKLPVMLVEALKTYADEQNVSLEYFVSLCLSEAIGKYEGLKKCIPVAYKQGFKECSEKVMEQARRQPEIIFKGIDLIEAVGYLQGHMAAKFDNVREYTQYTISGVKAYEG